MAASSKKNNKRSGNPAKRSTAKTWKRERGEDLELPSGNVALVKRPGPQALLSEGILPDTLMPIVQQAISKGKGLRPQDMKKALEDPAKVADMLDSMDRLMVQVVIEPKVAYHKCRKLVDMGGATAGPAHDEWVSIPEHMRDGETECENCGKVHPATDDFIYADDVDMEDKMFIFNYAVGGTRDLERFRSEHAARVGDLSDGSGDEDPTE